MNKILMLMLSACCAFLVACGGGGGGEGGGSATGSESRTAAQYFSKTAVGNTWTTLLTSTDTYPGHPTSTSTVTTVNTIISSVDGVVSYNTKTSGGPGFIAESYTITTQLDATGAMVSTDGTDTILELPATFSVGTTWIYAPANPAADESAVTATIAAFGVTRTVPAGTFTDCLQINANYSYTYGGVKNTRSFTFYLSPTAGSMVEATGSSSSTNGATKKSNTVLQAGYIANP